MKRLIYKTNTIFVISFLTLMYSCSNERYPGSLSPEESIKAMKVHKDFKIEVFAAEPHIKDPISMVFDEQGNAYVVEMPDYPFSDVTPNEPGEGKGRIVFLKDNDGDGVIDESILFVEGISEITSMLPWKGGLLVTAAPNILFLKDTDGDGKADLNEVLFTGFFTKNSEAQITNLRFGIDNWIYASNHGQAGTITSPKNPDSPSLSIGGSDFRFRLDKDVFELETAPAQFGQTLNDWGHRFMTQNTLHIQQAVMPRRYMERHDHLPSKRGVENISDHELRMFQITPAPYWRAERSRRRQEQYDAQGVDRVEHPEGHFTGASGGTVYAGDAFPEEFYGNIFTGEVAGNLVHRDVLEPHPSSPKYIAKRADNENDREFISSTDTWFRPTEFSVGPDGNLYMVDMYRQHIETPLSIPEDLLEDMDYTKGMDMGRIYRIVPQSKKESDIDLTAKKDKSTLDYVKLLEHPNQWWRLQAQKQILEKQDKSIVPNLLELFNSSTDPRVRLHSFYALDGLESLDAGLVRRAMKDAHPGVREHGIIISEKYPENMDLLVQMIDDASPRVSFQAALSLGQFSSNLVVDKLSEVTDKKHEDQWFRMAVLSSDAGSSYELFDNLFNKKEFFNQVTDSKKLFVNDLAFILAGKNKGLEKMLDKISNEGKENREEWLQAILAGVKKSYDKREIESQSLKNILDKIFEKSSEAIQGDINELLKK